MALGPTCSPLISRAGKYLAARVSNFNAPRPLVTPIFTSAATAQYTKRITGHEQVRDDTHDFINNVLQRPGHHLQVQGIEERNEAEEQDQPFDESAGHLFQRAPCAVGLLQHFGQAGFLRGPVIQAGHSQQLGCQTAGEPGDDPECDQQNDGLDHAGQRAGSALQRRHNGEPFAPDAPALFHDRAAAAFSARRRSPRLLLPRRVLHPAWFQRRLPSLARCGNGFNRSLRGLLFPGIWADTNVAAPSTAASANCSFKHFLIRPFSLVCAAHIRAALINQGPAAGSASTPAPLARTDGVATPPRAFQPAPTSVLSKT